MKSKLLISLALSGLMLVSCKPSLPAADPAVARVEIGLVRVVEGVDEDHALPIVGGKVREFVLVISAVELLECESLSLVDWIIPRAYAHVPSTGTRMGVPWVEDLLDPSPFARVIGDIGPPLAKYCDAYVILSPADDDAVNFSRVDGDDILDYTAILRIEVLDTDTGEPEIIEWRSDAALAVPMELIDPETGRSPLRLQRPDDQAMILVEKTIKASIFEGFDPEDEDFLETVLSRVSETIRVHRFDSQE